MLQLSTSNLDIIKVSKILAQFKVKASTSKTGIILNDGDISEELINALISSGIEIDSIRNFMTDTDESLFEDKTLNIDDDETSSGFFMKDGTHITRIPANCKEYDLLFPTVKRGEVYMCDFGEPYGCEFGYKHPAVIIQNDILENIQCPSTIVLPCSSSDTRIKNKSYSKYISDSQVFDRKTVIITQCIKRVSKVRLRKFLGTLDDKTMDELECRVHFVTGKNKKPVFNTNTQ